MAKSKLTLEERFWSKVLKTDTCWLWQRHVNNKGYGCLSYNYGDGHRPIRPIYAHRLSWMLSKGPIPPHLNVLHRCDVPGCVNPDHLFLGTQADNMHDCFKKTRHRLSISNQKVTPDQVRSIRNDDRPTSVIAAEYGIGRRTVISIRARITWRHIV
jgi:hypothetical protein